MVKRNDRSVPSLYMGNGNGRFEAGGTTQRMGCQPVGVRRIRPACWSDSRASPSRSFLTASSSRSLARVSTPCSVSSSNARS